MSKRKRETSAEKPAPKVCIDCNREQSKDCKFGPGSRRCNPCYAKRQLPQRRERARKIAEMVTNDPTAFGASKTCTLCETDLPRSEFRSNFCTSDGKQSRCNTCNDVHVYKLRLAAGKFRKQWLKTRPCSHCGETDTRVLQSAHLERSSKYRTKNGKPREPSNIRGLRKLERELSKCKSLCVFCHQISTSTENGKTKDKIKVRNMDIANAEKMRRGNCNLCQKRVTADTFSCFHYDHIRADQKINAIGTLVGRRLPVDVINEEMKKCQLLCSRCHILEVCSHSFIANRVITELNMDVHRHSGGGTPNGRCSSSSVHKARIVFLFYPNDSIFPSPTFKSQLSVK